MLLTTLAALAGARASAAPLGTLRIEGAENTTVVALRTEGASVRARRGGQDTWVLRITDHGPELQPGADATPPPCDATLHATLAVDDLDGNGRIDPTRGERAMLLASAVWRDGTAWRSAVMAFDLSPDGTARRAWQHDSATVASLGRLAAPPTPLRLAHSGTAAIDTVVVASGWSLQAVPGDSSSKGSLLQFDARTGQLLPMLFEAHVPLVGGVTAVDVDSDGITDRLYLADAAWHVWRLQRTSGQAARAARFIATPLADLSTLSVPGAALQFAPDVALTAGTPATLAITVGSSNAPAQLALRHWLFVLRDPLVASGLAPIRAEDLQRVGTTSDAPLERSARGLAVPLPGPLAAPVLTVAGHRLVVTSTSGGGASCPLRVEEHETLQLSVLTPTLEWHTRTVTAERGALLSLARRELDDEGNGSTPAPPLECLLGDVALPMCPQVRSVRRDYWVREDAQ